ncbi:hypothetical protein HQ560_07735 [bacterium]|nr:hypothetical protein [bacterium]
MPRRRQDVDWYCEMSEWLERKERRRKWIWLAILVSLPLLLMGVFVVGVELHSRGGAWVPQFVKRIFKPRPRVEGPVTVKLEIFDPVTVESIIQQNIRFTQLDANGLQTTITYFFREVPLQLSEDAATGRAKKGFIIIRAEKEDEGVVEKYHLVNSATGESFEFESIEAKRISEAVGWRLTDDGWKKVRDDLRARMQVTLSLPNFQ